MNFNMQDFLEAATSVANGEMAGHVAAQQQQYERQQRAFQQNLSLFNEGASLENEARGEHAAYTGFLERQGANVAPEQRGGYMTQVGQQYADMAHAPRQFSPQRLADLANQPGMEPARNLLRPGMPQPGRSAPSPMAPQAPPQAPLPAEEPSYLDPLRQAVMEQVAPLLPGGVELFKAVREGLAQGRSQPAAPPAPFAPPGISPVTFGTVDKATMSQTAQIVRAAHDRVAHAGQSVHPLDLETFQQLASTIVPPYDTEAKLQAANQLLNFATHITAGHTPAAENAGTHAAAEQSLESHRDAILRLRGQAQDDRSTQVIAARLQKLIAPAQLAKLAGLNEETRAFYIDQIGQHMAALGEDLSTLPPDVQALLSPRDRAQIDLWGAEQRQMDSLLPYRKGVMGAQVDHTRAETVHVKGQERRAEEEEPFRLDRLRERAHQAVLGGRFDDRTKKQIQMFQQFNRDINTQIGRLEGVGIVAGSFDMAHPHNARQARLAALYAARTENERREQHYLRGLGIDNGVTPQVGAFEEPPAPPAPEGGIAAWFKGLTRFLSGQGAPPPAGGMPAVGGAGLAPAPVRQMAPPAAGGAAAPTAPARTAGGDYVQFGGRLWDAVALRRALETRYGKTKVESNKIVLQLRQGRK